MAEVITFETPSLGNRSYLVTDGDAGVVIDPQRDIERFAKAAAEAGVTITHVLETHVHNDYVSGGPALCQLTGATYGVHRDSGVEVAHLALDDGDEVAVGAAVLRVIHTPGHTPQHVSYALVEDGAVTDVFTGGSLLYGAVGRTDLISSDLTVELSRAQHASVHRLADELPDTTEVRPTHGFGSHCASVSSDELAREGTIADERERNPALTTADVDRFVDELIAGLHPYPTYYAAMGPRNVAGAAAADVTLPRPLDPAELRAHLHAGHWVVDLRTRRAYAADHVRGTVNIELRNDLPTYLGWVIPVGAPLVLLGPDEADVTEALVMLSRIGVEDLDGAATGSPEDWAPDSDRSSSPVASWGDLGDALAERDDIVVLDVRDAWEFVQGAHAEAINIPFHEVLDRLDEIPDGEVWVSCATGNRAAVAASLLEREGRGVVLIDDFCLPGDTPGR